ncbi:MAG: fibronectin type III domain-containing protein, partial [Actinomycetota bacterium]|nr:fibronectin type III domain-containing protein [Actinomycetota bacterium]
MNVRWFSTAVRVVLLSAPALALVSASVPASVSHAETAGAIPGRGRGAAAVIDAGGSHSCVVLENGAVKCWGYNAAGQLGYGDTEWRGDGPGEMGNNLAPIDLGSGRTAIAIDAGGYHTCALLENGTVKCWGNNFFGDLGYGDTEPRGDGPGEMGNNLAPVDLGAGRTASAITAGSEHTCAVLDDGTVKCWGLNLFGQLGYGDTNHRGDDGGEMGDNLAPVDLGAGRTASAITAGGLHTCALLDDGTVKCWGRNSSGQLGYGDISLRGDGAGEMGDNLAPVDVGAGRTAVAIIAGGAHTCALLDDGTVKCWGLNGDGQLGQSDNDNRGDGSDEMGDFLHPTDLGSGRTAIAITAAAYHTCVLLDDGTIRCWGANNFGQLGYPGSAFVGTAPSVAPLVNVGTGRTAIAITASGFHTCALLDNDTVKCWGLNGVGALGYGDTEDRGDIAGEMGDNLAPVSVDNSLSVVPVDAAPAPPSGLSAAAGPGSASLTWSAPDDDGGQPVSGYRIESSTDGVLWTTVVADTGSTATSYTTGLKAGVRVRFRVAAINAVGVSPSTLPTPPVSLVDVVSLTPARLLDTRGPSSTVDGAGAGAGPAAAGSITEVQVAGRGGVPTDA